MTDAPEPPPDDTRALARLQLIGLIVLIVGSAGLKLLYHWTSLGMAGTMLMLVGFVAVYAAIFVPRAARAQGLTVRQVLRQTEGPAAIVRRWLAELRR